MRRKSNKVYNKIIFVFALLVLLVVGIRSTLARYSSSGES